VSEICVDTAVGSTGDDVLMDSKDFASRLTDLVAQVKNGDREQASLAVGDSIAFLKQLLVPLPDRSKTGSRSQAPPIIPAADFGVLRVRATLLALNTARDGLSKSDMKQALEASLGALKAWQQEPTE